ncbi:AsmA family protein [Foetidibacter luteolus]|uniref:AsmA family protein n=1 Tax=Foetidibacter luteolus TaxID=2608880 RepID=UPI00129A2B1A|nr:AsmA family protein [Foetidibacter luteolus]
MRISPKKFVLKTLKITGIVIGSILLLMFLLPIVFPGFVSKQIKSWTNSALTSELNFSKSRLSFFNHFPSLTLTLYDVTLKGSAPYQQQNLISASELALGVNIPSIFSDRIKIDEIYLTKSDINIRVDSLGRANYNVYKSDTVQANPADSSSASLKIEKIQIDDSNLLYDDLSIPIVITAKELNYVGKGDLSKAIFDLYSKIEVDSLNLDYDGTHYIGAKQLEGNLITKINTNSLELFFEKNDLQINKLPVDFKGKFEFLDNGYNMDFRILSKKTNLRDAFTALPPEYLHWLDSTEINGYSEMDAYLTGKYIAEQNIMPTLGFNMKVRDGFIAHNKAPFPIKNLFLNFDTKLPSLNTDSLYVNIDSIFFNIEKDYFSTVLLLKGMKEPYIKTKLNSSIDLEKWHRAMGISAFDLKGRADIHLTADGNYATKVVQRGLRRTDTVTSSIPSFSLQSVISNGYFKLSALPQPVTNISFNVNASCPDSNYQHASLALENLNMQAMSNFIKGYFKVSGAKDFPIDASLTSTIRLADIQKIYPMDSLQLAGNLEVDIKTSGKLNPANKLFPVTKALFLLKDGSIQTKYYPRPINKIQVDVSVTSTKGSLQDLAVKLKPISFEFEEQPFLLKADLNNFNDLRYSIASKGVIDIGKIYRAFAVKGYNLNGFIKTNLSLQGTQSDATAGRYGRLNNRGTLTVKDIALTSDSFPLPFLINNGVFRFDRDKMWFDAFSASYGQSNLTLKGYLSNVINYAIAPNEPLKGSFDFNSKYVLADELMAFAGSDTASTASAVANTETGVVIVPANLSLILNASANKVSYNGLDIKDFKGSLIIDSGKLKMNKTGFTIIDAPVSMEATYGSLSPKKAFFDYHISAQEFDIKKAFNEIKIFRDLATSAGKTEGIVSLDYSLSGKLDQNMNPIYPSLKGGGVLSLKKVKVKGLKLFAAVSKETGRDSVNNPSLSKVNIKSTIANNIITIERTKMRVFGFRPRFEGQVSFDGRLNLSARLGLPPFGIFGIPFTVTGTQENPKVKLRRSRNSDKLEETQEEPDEEDKAGTEK